MTFKKFRKFIIKYRIEIGIISILSIQASLGYNYIFTLEKQIQEVSKKHEEIKLITQTTKTNVTKMVNEYSINLESHLIKNTKYTINDANKDEMLDHFLFSIKKTDEILQKRAELEIDLIRKLSETTNVEETRKLFELTEWISSDMMEDLNIQYSHNYKMIGLLMATQEKLNDSYKSEHASR